MIIQLTIVEVLAFYVFLTFWHFFLRPNNKETKRDYFDKEKKLCLLIISGSYRIFATCCVSRCHSFHRKNKETYWPNWKQGRISWNIEKEGKNMKKSLSK